MKRIIQIIIAIHIIVISGCSTSVNTKEMIGLPFRECVNRFKLDKHSDFEHLYIPTIEDPSRPVGTDKGFTYFLPDGNLYLYIDKAKNIIAAEYKERDAEGERVKEWVDEQKWMKPPQPENPLDSLQSPSDL